MFFGFYKKMIKQKRAFKVMWPYPGLLHKIRKSGFCLEVYAAKTKFEFYLRHGDAGAPPLKAGRFKNLRSCQNFCIS